MQGDPTVQPMSKCNSAIWRASSVVACNTASCRIYICRRHACVLTAGSPSIRTEPNPMPATIFLSLCLLSCCFSLPERHEREKGRGGGREWPCRAVDAYSTLVKAIVFSSRVFFFCISRRLECRRDHGSRVEEERYFLVLRFCQSSTTGFAAYNAGIEQCTRPFQRCCGV